MNAKLPRIEQELAYERWARAYLRRLPLEHFMEGIEQSTQRKITLESLDLVKARRPDFHVFSEMLVQYPRRGQKRPGQVVPDNMVVLSAQAPRAKLSFNRSLEPAGPYWVLEYVSMTNKRKDYDESFIKYERDLKVPYYLIYHGEVLMLGLYRHNKRKYVAVKPNEAGRLALPELEIEVALLDHWVRFWYQGNLLPLPGEMLHQLDDAKRELDTAQQQLEAAQRELAALRARLGP